jgi:hypothetical protein
VELSDVRNPLSSIPSDLDPKERRMGPVLTRPAPTRSAGAVLALVLAVVAGLAAAAFVLEAMRSPSFVKQVTVENPTVYQLEVDVSDGRQGWLGLGAVVREGTQTFLEVIDQGDTWVFRFAYGGIDGGEITLRREELARSRWRVRVPDEVRARLAAAGLEPSARQ